MPAEDIADVVTAIGNHDEGTAAPVNAISAALFLADKSDVRRTRVRNHDFSTFDIHDRVNYSVSKYSLTISEDNPYFMIDENVVYSKSDMSVVFENTHPYPYW